jgi:hypothetical protein
MVMTYRYMVSLCSAGRDKIKHYDCIYGNDRLLSMPMSLRTMTLPSSIS